MLYSENLFVWLCKECHDPPAHSKEQAIESHVDGQALKDLTIKSTKIPCANENENPIVQKNRDRPTFNRYKRGTCRHSIKGNKEVDGKKVLLLIPNTVLNSVGLVRGEKCVASLVKNTDSSNPFCADYH